MIGISVLITKYISDDPQPGIVECQLSEPVRLGQYRARKQADVSAISRLLTRAVLISPLGPRE